MKNNVMREHMNDRFGKVFNFTENPPLPKSLNIELNNTCNHSCVFCPYHGEYGVCDDNPSVMSFENVKRILEEAKKLGIGEKEVGFYLSGEAFLYNRLPEVISYAKALGFSYVFITTNGALATPDKMKTVLDAGLDSIRFSINASDRETYKNIHGRDDFDIVINNIKYMRSYINDNNLDVATSISCVLTKKTSDIQGKIHELFDDYVDDILFIPVILSNIGCDESFVEEYQIISNSDITLKKDFICPIIFDTLYIRADLTIVPCCEARLENGVLYDLKEKFDLEAAWNCIEYKQYRNIFIHNTDVSGTLCEKCPLRLEGPERLGL